MLGMRFVRLIETHSQKLTLGLVQKLRTSERTSDFRKIPAEELQTAVTEVYRNLGEWLLQKTEKDIALRFRAIGTRRAVQGISLHHLVWALMLSRDHLFTFLQREAFADNVFELHGELELHQLLNQLVGVLIAWGLAIVGTLVILKVVDVTLGLRVSADDETQGLDLSQHGEEGYYWEAS